MAWIRHLRELRDEESGMAALVTISAGIVLLLAVAALVIDLGSLRSVRSRGRLATDAAAAAGALTLAATGPQDACLTALGFAESNLPGDPVFLGAD
ncbi:MAG: hypothetical protein R3246_16875, partial [Acidimicrobiia bacterium]|nr:hypothetical protein [Acidimicrobiia bacterium]